MRKILKANCLNTVCENARCPNKNECYTKHTATFLIMGGVCTRNCKYCNISCQKPEPLDVDEPKHIAKAVKDLGLKYAVITSVTRDDLPDGGAEHFAKCIEEIRKISPDTKIEILTPDFKGNKYYQSRCYSLTVSFILNQKRRILIKCIKLKSKFQRYAEYY